MVQEIVGTPGAPRAPAANPDMNEIIDLLPTPALVVSPSNQIQRVSLGLLKEWGRRGEEFIGGDLFTVLYQDSPTERFDRIPLAYAIETAIAARRPQLCHGAYVSNHIAWSARVVPVYRQDCFLCLLIEWEHSELRTGHTDVDPIHGWLSVDEMFRHFVQAVTDYAIFLLDTRGYAATWNIGAEVLKGYKNEEIIGKHFSLFYSEDDLRAGKPEKLLESCLRKGRIEDEGWRYRKDGSRFWASVVITAIHRNGVHIGFGKVTRDLTERKQAEMRVIAAYEESTKLKNDFLANMSHEIRTPMHGMLSACALLLNTPLSLEQRETAGIIEESGHVLRQIIDDILDYSKLASGRFNINSGTIRLNDVMSSVVRSVQTTLQPGVSLHLTMERDLPETAQGDPLRLRQIVYNIAGNAAKFTEEGSISLHTSLIAEDDEAYTILTEVSDTGPGVSDKDAAHLFDPFTQVDTTTTKRYRGTGLGLLIAKSIVELMDGNIGYRPNDKARGSVFWFTSKLRKPRVVQQANDVTIASSHWTRPVSAEAGDANSSIGRLREVAPMKRILAAEDNSINQKVLTRMLQSFGFEHITVVSDGAKAVLEFENASEPYDCVLMDISMPIMDGRQATGHIKKADERTPIIAMTAYALEGDREQCLSAGMDDYVPKPVNRQLLAAKLLKWLIPDHREPVPAAIKRGELSNSCSLGHHQVES